MIAKLMLQNTLVVVGMAALLFGTAGTMQWPSAWVFLIASAILGPACGLWLGRTDPALLAERMRLWARNQPAADKFFMIAFVAAIVIWYAVMGRERGAYVPDMPLALQALGFAMYLASIAFIMWVFRVNSFAAPVVKVQTERQHHVVSTGPYAYIRHPMYAGMMIYFVGLPILLGSWRGLAMAPLFLLLMGIRTRIEERTLLANLPGYADYTARIRYRLIPGIW